MSDLRVEPRCGLSPNQPEQEAISEELSTSAAASVVEDMEFSSGSAAQARRGF